MSVKAHLSGDSATADHRDLRIASAARRTRVGQRRWYRWPVRLALYIAALGSAIPILQACNATDRNVTRRPPPGLPPVADSWSSPGRPYIAVIAPFSSEFTGAAGKGMVRGIHQLAQEHREQLAQRNINVVYLNDRSSEARAGAFARAIVNDPNALAIIGAADSHCTRAIVREVEGARFPLPVISPISTRSEISDDRRWIFRTNLTDRQIVTSLFNHLTKRENAELLFEILTERQILTSLFSFFVDHELPPPPYRFAAVFVDSYYGQGLHKVLSQLCTEGPEDCLLVASEDYEQPLEANKQHDIVDRIVRAHPDMVALLGQSPPSGRFAKMLRERMPDVILFTTPANSAPSFFEAAGARGSEGVITATSFSSKDVSNHKAIEFRNQFKQRYGVPPDTFGAQSYESAMLLVSALERDGPYTTLDVLDEPTGERRRVLRERILHNETNGILGAFAFDARRFRRLEPDILIWNDGRTVPIDIVDRPLVPDLSSGALGMLAGLVWVAVFFLLCWIKHPLVARWLPLSSTVGAALAVKGSDLIGYPIDLTAFAVTVVAGSFSLFFALGMWGRSAPILVHAEPFRSLHYLMLAFVPPFRARYYRPLVAAQCRAVEADRKANSETYVALPADLSFYDVGSRAACAVCSGLGGPQRLEPVPRGAQATVKESSGAQTQTGDRAGIRNLSKLVLAERQSPAHLRQRKTEHQTDPCDPTIRGRVGRRRSEWAASAQRGAASGAVHARDDSNLPDSPRPGRRGGPARAGPLRGPPAFCGVWGRCRRGRDRPFRPGRRSATRPLLCAYLQTRLASWVSAYAGELRRNDILRALSAEVRASTVSELAPDAGPARAITVALRVAERLERSDSRELDTFVTYRGTPARLFKTVARAVWPLLPESERAQALGCAAPEEEPPSDDDD